MLAAGHKSTSLAIVLGYCVNNQVVNIQHLPSSCALVTGTIIGSILPDIDTKSSQISQIIKIPCYKLFKHRNQTHGLFAWLIISGMIYFLLNHFYGFSQLDSPELMISYNLWLGLTIGYLLHLIEDSFSSAGIRWFAPISQYDTWAYQHYGTYLRRPYRFKDIGTERKVPIRHWWGRGYTVGGSFEVFITVVSQIAILYFFIKWLFLLF